MSTQTLDQEGPQDVGTQLVNVDDPEQYLSEYVMCVKGAAAEAGLYDSSPVMELAYDFPPSTGATYPANHNDIMQELKDLEPRPAECDQATTWGPLAQNTNGPHPHRFFSKIPCFGLRARDIPTFAPQIVPANGARRANVKATFARNPTPVYMRITVSWVDIMEDFIDFIQTDASHDGRNHPLWAHIHAQRSHKQQSDYTFDMLPVCTPAWF
eukprot:TRINITY_DN48308_c0_g1_i1.p1 TRINITY_DN48308_c0_g1~~TRINITY_DN48308_c0_g1_i1.p1  ORF type:complete len:212 (-),score=19.33 TRINITY_DN48308_c0_g1_i1:56-691(-)